MRHAIIMAGGSGTRLWPLSRQRRPKQLLRLFGGKSLLQIARDRLIGLFEPECIWVITSADYIDQVASELPDLPRENLISEPEGRDTANAIGLAAALLARRDPDATMAVFTADHIIQPPDRFATAIRVGLEAAERNHSALITFGITPKGPHTGYGYLHRGAPVAANVYRVRGFTEKPASETAEFYVSSGEYYWNSGMFVWRVSAIQAELRRHLPDNAADLASIAADWGSDAATAAFRELFKISIDFGVMEKAKEVMLVEMPVDWVDLGSWSAIASVQAADEHGNAAVAENALAVDSGDNLIIADDDHLVVALGVSNLVIVHTADATLICHRGQEQRIKELAELRRARFGERFD